MFRVLVGNIGTVYTGDDENEARELFNNYCESSQSWNGMAGGESVTLFDGEEILEDFFPERDMGELLEEWQKKNGNIRGLRLLNKLCADMGYHPHRFAHGSPFEEFISDNPGVIEAILGWIEEQNLPEWKESFDISPIER